MSSIRFMIFAGLPATIQLEGTSPITTEPAPIITLEPMVMLPIIQTLAPIWTLFPMVGAFSPFIHPIFFRTNGSVLPYADIVSYDCFRMDYSTPSIVKN